MKLLLQEYSPPQQSQCFKLLLKLLPLELNYLLLSQQMQMYTQLLPK